MRTNLSLSLESKIIGPCELRALNSMIANNPRVAVVIVRWNQFDDTRETLESASNIRYPNYFVVVVDNGSSDGYSDILKESFSDVHFIIKTENLGFAGGANLGIHDALEKGTEYILFLNNDLIVDSSIISELVSVAESKPKVGIVGALMYYFKYPETIWSAGGSYEINTGKAGLIGFNEKDHGQYDSPFEADYICGCGMLIKRSVFESIGFFDESFFHCGEDVDICIRARKAGYHILTAPHAKLWHKVAKSVGGIASSMYLYYRFRSNLMLIRKYQSGSSRRYLINFLFMCLSNSIREIKRNNPGGSYALLRVVADFLNGMSGNGDH